MKYSMYQIKLQLFNEFGFGGERLELWVKRFIILDSEDGGVGEENLGRKIEEPTDEIGGSVKKKWQNVDSGKIGDEDSEVATDEEDET